MAQMFLWIRFHSKLLLLIACSAIIVGATISILFDVHRSLQPIPEIPTVRLIEEGYKGFNILKFGPDKFIALAQGEGEFLPGKLAAGGYQQVYVGGSADEVKAKIPAK